MPRDHIKPSITLQQTIFSFIEKEIESIDAANNSTAYEFLKNMSHHLNLVQDPVDLRIDSILPGVKDRFTNLHSEMRANFSQLNDRVDGLIRPQHLQYLLNHLSSFDFSSSAQSSSSMQAK